MATKQQIEKGNQEFWKGFGVLGKMGERIQEKQNELGQWALSGYRLLVYVVEGRQVP